MEISTGDEYQDHVIRRGESWAWSFQLVPLDLTGCTASLDAGALGTFSLSVSTELVGVNPYGTVAGAIEDTSALAPGIYDYRVLVTFTDGQVWRFGHGKMFVQ